MSPMLHSYLGIITSHEIRITINQPVVHVSCHDCAFSFAHLKIWSTKMQAKKLSCWHGGWNLSRNPKISGVSFGSLDDTSSETTVFWSDFYESLPGLSQNSTGNNLRPRFDPRRRRAWPWKPPKPWPPPWHLAPHPWAPHRYPAGSRHRWRLLLWEHRSLGWTLKGKLAGGFKNFLFSPQKLFGEEIHPFWQTCIFFRWGPVKNHQLENENGYIPVCHEYPLFEGFFGIAFKGFKW